MKRRAASRELADLDRECLQNAVGFLGVEDRARLMATSLEMHAVASAAVHWQRVALRGAGATGLGAVAACVRRTDAKHPLQVLTVEGTTALEQHLRHEDDLAHVAGSCTRCAEVIAALPGHLFRHLETLELRRLPWLTDCVAEHILANAPALKMLQIEQNINVNRVVRQVAKTCHALEVLCFKYIEVSGLAIEAATGPQHSLEAAAVADLTGSCTQLRRVCFNHYVIEEDAVQGLLKASGLEEVDLSDNEGLHGFFLSEVPRAWPRLRHLTLRDCTEVQETAVTELVQKIVNGACERLTSIDVSCQWAHVNESFLHDPSLRDELAKRRPELRWREDHCQIPGFGIDPDEEIWLHSDDNVISDGYEPADTDDGETVMGSDDDISFGAVVRIEDVSTNCDGVFDEVTKDQLLFEEEPSVATGC